MIHRNRSSILALLALALLASACAGLHPVGARIRAPGNGASEPLAYSALSPECGHRGKVAAHRRGDTDPTEVVQVLWEQTRAIDGDTFLIVHDDGSGWGSTTYAEVYRCKPAEERRAAPGSGTAQP